MIEGARANERTCVGCGAKASRADLVRLRIVDGKVAAGVEGMGGRGAWLHASRQCLWRAMKRRAFARAFRAADAAVEDPEILAAQLTRNARRY